MNSNLSRRKTINKRKLQRSCSKRREAAFCFDFCLPAVRLQSCANRIHFSLHFASRVAQQANCGLSFEEMRLRFVPHAKPLSREPSKRDLLRQRDFGNCRPANFCRNCWRLAKCRVEFRARFEQKQSQQKQLNRESLFVALLQQRVTKAANCRRVANCLRLANLQQLLATNNRRFVARQARRTTQAPCVCRLAIGYVASIVAIKLG